MGQRGESDCATRRWPVVGSTLSNGILYSHGTWDSYYTVNLPAGSYLATIAQFDNFSKTLHLSDGFTYDANPNFTFDNGYGGATQPFFNGVWDRNDPRTGHWAFHLLNVEQAVIVSGVPDSSSTVGLLTVALVGIGVFRRKLTN